MTLIILTYLFTYFNDDHSTVTFILFVNHCDCFYWKLGGIMQYIDLGWVVDQGEITWPYIASFDLSQVYARFYTSLIECYVARKVFESST